MMTGKHVSATVLAISILLSFSSVATCWSSLGHRTIAYIAQSVLQDQGAWLVHHLLGGADISDASLWASEILHPGTPEGDGTEPWHYMPFEHDPPEHCNAAYARDGERDGGNLVTAIGQMTARLLKPDTTFREQQKALKFLLHLIGDAHQPLHVSRTRNFGKDIGVKFDGKHTTLHEVWDEGILRKHVGGDTARDEKTSARELAGAIFERRERDIVKGIVDAISGQATLQVSWTDCSITDVPVEDCPLKWVTETNSWVCGYVLRDGVEEVEGRELGGKYYDRGVIVVEEALGKAGYRLAGWIDGIANIRFEAEKDGVSFDG